MIQLKEVFAILLVQLILLVVVYLIGVPIAAFVTWAEPLWWFGDWSEGWRSMFAILLTATPAMMFWSIAE